MEVNLVEIWLRRDKKRWLAGALGGLFAGIASLAFAMGLCLMAGSDVWMPIKAAALPILGGPALNWGLHWDAILTGFALYEFIAMFLGVIYAHFTGTNHLGALLGVGFSFGCFSWIFIGNLFSASFRDVHVADLHKGGTFFVCIVFGIALCSVAFFDKAVRR